MVVKMSEEGSYLYLKRQSEGTWIERQVLVLKHKATISMKRAPYLGF
jgi:hypothetical protein